MSIRARPLVVGSYPTSGGGRIAPYRGLFDLWVDLDVAVDTVMSEISKARERVVFGRAFGHRADVDRVGLRAGADRTERVARTYADLIGSERITAECIEVAKEYTGD